jgi:hypothetical protein
VSPKKVIHKRIRRSGKGFNVAADINAVVSSNVGERATGSKVSSRQRTRIVQRSNREEPRKEVKEDG